VQAGIGGRHVDLVLGQPVDRGAESGVLAVAHQLGVAVLDVLDDVRRQGLAEPEGPELAMRGAVLGDAREVVELGRVVGLFLSAYLCATANAVPVVRCRLSPGWVQSALHGRQISTGF
jgi:hypothetical protein